MYADDISFSLLFFFFVLIYGNETIVIVTVNDSVDLKARGKTIRKGS